jgi:hypothetical protein
VIPIPVRLALLGTLAGLWLLAGSLAARLQVLVLVVTRSPDSASIAYDLVVFPGVVVHEAAHLLAAFVLRVRILRADLFRFRRAGDSRQGEVIVERVDPLRMSLIGAAPLLLGIPLVLWLLSMLPVPPLGLQWDVVPGRVSREPLHWIGLYLVWAISNTMFPSSSDRAAWWVVGVAASVAVVLVVLTGQRLSIPEHLQASVLEAAARLTSGLLPVLILDLVLLAALIGLQWIVSQITGRHVVRR